MIHAGSYLVRMSKNSDGWLIGIIFLTPALFLVLKGAATTGLFLLFFICGGLILREPRKFFVGRGFQFWIIVLCLLAPFLTELIVQVGRGVFILPGLDGPSRTLLAAGVFVYLSKKNSTHIISALSAGSAVGILLVFLYLQIFPEHYWEHRAATSFVDPITLPCYTLVLLGIFLFTGLPSQLTRYDNVAKFSLAALTIYISIESQSRSAWVAGIVLMESYILIHFVKNWRAQILVTIAFVVCVFVLFYAVDVVNSRTYEAVKSVSVFMGAGEPIDTPTGIRIQLAYLDLLLIKDNYLWGVSDGEIPSFENLKSAIPSLTGHVYDIKLLAGSHSEFLGQIVGKGVVFGALSLWGLICHPILFLLWKHRNFKFLGTIYGGAALGLVLPVVVSSMFIQVFNLKMTISFYVMVLAIFYAHVFYMAQKLQHDPSKNRLNAVD